MRRTILVLTLFVASCSIYEEPDGPPPAPPISGGTLLVTADGRFAVASDPARDQVFRVELATERLVAQIGLEPGDQPGRLIEDGAGRIHVALRGGGALATLVNDEVVARRSVCPEPRGVAWQQAGDLVHVACAGGELVTFPAAGGDAVRRLQLDRDLRDVLVFGDELRVTLFRVAEILRINADGNVISRRQPAAPLRTIFTETGELVDRVSAPTVMWRAVRGPGNDMVVLHQRATGGPLSFQQNGYGGGDCGDGPIEATAWVFDAGEDDATAAPAPVTRKLPFGVLPVDVAISLDGRTLAIVQAGTRSIRLVTRFGLEASLMDPCGFNPDDREIPAGYEGYGAPLSVAFTTDERLVIQYDNAIVVDDDPVWGSGGTTTQRFVALPLPYRNDPGRLMFHKATSSGLACASCHPEGREDGLVWDFGGFGRRRTQNVGGFLLERAPYHWNGDMTDLHRLVNEVFVMRMGGEMAGPGDIEAIRQWLGTVPAMKPTRPGNFAAIERGRGLFADLGCATCHSGPLYTNNQLTDVGTGGTFKVPSLLGVASRPPYLHDGCAATLADRFGPCGGDNHGTPTDPLTPEEIDDLVKFLETL